MVKIPVTIQGKETWIHEELKKKLDHGTEIIKDNWDLIFIVDGLERSGKSTLAITCGGYLADRLGTPFTINNISKDSADAKSKLEHLPDRSVLIIDEGSLVFSSRDSGRKEQKELIKILNVIGQKNMVLIIVLPSFFRLNDYISIDRARFLLHVYSTTQNGKEVRGRFCYFGQYKKKLLFEEGKKFKSYRNPKADFVGDYPDLNLFGTEYSNILKRNTLASAFHNDDVAHGKKELKMAKRFESLVKFMLKNNTKVIDIIDHLKEDGVGVHEQELYRLSKKFKREKNQKISKIENPQVPNLEQLYYKTPVEVNNG